MIDLPSPTTTPQHLHRSSPPRPTQTPYVRDDDDDGSDIWSSICTTLPGNPHPVCFPPYPPSHPPTSGLFPTTLSVSTTTETVTQTAAPSSSGGGASIPSGRDPTSATMPVSSSGFPLIVPDNRGLSAGELAGVIVGSVGGAFLLLLFLWLLRRGAFGSGTLFGFRYGDARKAGWGRAGAGSEMRQKSREGYVRSALGPGECRSRSFVYAGHHSCICASRRVVSWVRRLLSLYAYLCPRFSSISSCLAYNIYAQIQNKH